MVYGLRSGGVSSTLRVIVFPSDDIASCTLLTGLPPRVFSNSYPAADLWHVIVEPFACAFGFPSQATLAMAFPLRVTVKDPHVEPVEISPNGKGEVVVKVHQVVRDPKGNLLADRLVIHVFQMRDGLIQRFDIRDV